LWYNSSRKKIERGNKMAELIVNEHDAKCLRFQCECNKPEHCMDVWIISENGIAITFEMYNVTLSDSNIIVRIVSAIRHILGIPIASHSFRLKKTDVQDLITYLNESKVIDIVSRFIGVK
jgi:hypothetical protein